MKTSKRYTAKEWAEVVDMFNQGATYQEIAEMTGRTPDAIRVKLNLAGMTRRPVSQKTENPPKEKKLVKIPTIEDFPPRDLIKRLYDLGYRIKNNKLYVVTEKVVNIADIIS